MAREAGVSDDFDVAELECGAPRDAFSEEERAALALTDAIVAGNVTEEVIAELDRHFDHAQRVELTVTAAFYAMVPRSARRARRARGGPGAAAPQTGPGGHQVTRRLIAAG